MATYSDGRGRLGIPDPNKSESARKAAATRAKREKVRRNLVAIAAKRGIAPDTKEFTQLAFELGEPYSDLIGTRWIPGTVKLDMSETPKKSPQQRWNESHPEVLQQCQEEYNKKRPVWSFRPTPENLEWLEEERWDSDGKPETDGALLNRKLAKLRKLEQQGF